MKNLFVTFLLAISLLATACAKNNEREEAINKLQQLTERLTQDTSNYTEEDWDNVAKEFEYVSVIIDENRGKFTAEERAKIDNLRAKCIGLFTAKAMQKATEAMGMAVQHFGGIMEGFLSGLGAVNEKAVTKSLTGVMEALSSSIEKSANQVELNISDMEKKMEVVGDSLEVLGERMGASFEAIGKSLEAIGESMERSVR